MEFRIAVAAAAFGLATIVPAQATPCMIVTITGAQGGPQAYQGQAGPGTLVRYGEDADDCNAVRLQFDTGRGTLLRLSQINVLSSQINAVFFRTARMAADYSARPPIPGARPFFAMAAAKRALMACLRAARRQQARCPRQSRPHRAHSGGDRPAD